MSNFWTAHAILQTYQRYYAGSGQDVEPGLSKRLALVERSVELDEDPD